MYQCAAIVGQHRLTEQQQTYTLVYIFMVRQFFLQDIVQSFVPLLFLISILMLERKL